MSEFVLDLSNPRQKLMLLDHVRVLSGPYRVDITRHRARRSDVQNRYYRGVVCPALADYLNAQGEPTTGEEAHGYMAAKFLRVTVTDPDTGEVIRERVRSTTELTTVEFFEYVDNCRMWLADFFHVDTPDPDPDYAAKRREHPAPAGKVGAGV